MPSHSARAFCRVRREVGAALRGHVVVEVGNLHDAADGVDLGAEHEVFVGLFFGNSRRLTLSTALRTFLPKRSRSRRGWWRCPRLCRGGSGDEVILAAVPHREGDAKAMCNVRLAGFVLLILVADAGELNGLTDPGTELHRERIHESDGRERPGRHQGTMRREAGSSVENWVNSTNVNARQWRSGARWRVPRSERFLRRRDPARLAETAGCRRPGWGRGPGGAA